MDSPSHLDQLQDRRVIERALARLLGGDPVPSGVRRHDDSRHTETVPVVAVPVGGNTVDGFELLVQPAHAQKPLDDSAGIQKAPTWSVVGFRRGTGWNVIEVPTVFVVEPDHKRVLPRLPMHHPVDHLGGEPFPDLYVLRVLLGEVPETRIDEAELRQVPTIRVDKDCSSDRRWLRARSRPIG